MTLEVFAVQEWLREILACPRCGGDLERPVADGPVRCVLDGCRAEYPVVDGIAVLLAEGRP